MTGGIVARFRTMRIARAGARRPRAGSLVLTLVGLPSWSRLSRSLLASGPRPTRSTGCRLAILILFAFALIWLSIALGLAAKSVETASNTPMFLTLLPFLSSGFVTLASLPPGLRQFARYQPFTPVTDSVRGLLFGGTSVASDILPAIAWSVGITLASYLWARRLYNRRSVT